MLRSLKIHFDWTFSGIFGANVCDQLWTWFNWRR
jgi:hypothetical protein